MNCCGYPVTRALTIASALQADSGSAQPAHDQPPSVRPPSSLTKPLMGNKRRAQPRAKQQKPSLTEIERAIGAGQFKDRNLSEKEENKTMFDSLLLNAMREDDSNVQKKLRETGEWIAEGTENASRNSGKQILTVMFSLIIPLGFLLLVASGIITLPLSTPYLEDLLS